MKSTYRRDSLDVSTSNASYTPYLDKGYMKHFSSFDILQYDDAEIVLLKDFPCNSKNALLARKRHWFDQYGEKCVNITQPIRTAAEKEAQRERRKVHNKLYRERDVERARELFQIKIE